MIRRFYIMPLNHRATPDKVAEFIDAYAACDSYLPGLFASAAGLDSANRTVVWENNFVDEETYSGLYMVHPYHAATLDSYLMADSPELITQDTFTVRYEIDRAVARIESGIRRLVLMKLPDQAETAASAALSGAQEHVATTVFSRDNVKWVSPKGKAWTHILEQEFTDDAALDAYLRTAHGIATSSKDALRRLGVDIDALMILTYPFSIKPEQHPAPLPADDTPVCYALTAQLAAEHVDAYVALLEKEYDPHLADHGGTLLHRLRTVDQGYTRAEVQSIWQLPSIAAYNPVRFATGSDARWTRYVQGATPIVKGGSRRFYRAV